MNCWHCERPAAGICRFCGRGLCKDHTKSMPYILSVYQGKGGTNKAIAVEDVMYCGTCKPSETGVELKNLT